MDMYVTLAKYNQWMNVSLYEKAIQLGQHAIEEDQGAFFGSILRTLNHLLIADMFWLSRCTGDRSVMQPKNAQGEYIKLQGLDTIVYQDVAELFEHRQRLDEKILAYVESLSGNDLAGLLAYSNSKGEALSNPLNVVLMHWFNHQTHHRGQITTLFNQQGIDSGVTDLIYIKDEF